MSHTVNFYRTKTPMVNSAFENIVFNLSIYKDRNDYTSFALCGSEPGVGTTTISVELSLALSDAGWKTVLVDVNFKKSSIYKRLADSTGCGLSDYSEGRASLDDILYQTKNENLFFIQSGQSRRKHGNPIQLQYMSKIDELIKELSKKFDFVIIDTPSISISRDSVYYALKADAVMLVAALDGAKKKHLRYAKEQLISSKANLIGVIENKVSIDTYKQYVKDYDYYEAGKYVKTSLRKKAGEADA